MTILEWDLRTVGYLNSRAIRIPWPRIKNALYASLIFATTLALCLLVWGVLLALLGVPVVHIIVRCYQISISVTIKFFVFFKSKDGIILNWMLLFVASIAYLASYANECLSSTYQMSRIVKFVYTNTIFTLLMLLAVSYALLYTR